MGKSNGKPSARPQGGGKFPTVTLYLSVIRPGHPLADKDGRVRVHRLVLFEKIGPERTVCHWCGCGLDWFGKKTEKLVADHIDSDRWNNNPENLVPACWECNIRRKRRAQLHCAKGHLLEGDNLYVRPDKRGRQCRICKQEALRRFYDKNRKRNKNP